MKMLLALSVVVAVLLTVAVRETAGTEFSCGQFQPAHYFSVGPAIAKVHAPHTATSNAPFTLSFD